MAGTKQDRTQHKRYVHKLACSGKKGLYSQHREPLAARLINLFFSARILCTHPPTECILNARLEGRFCGLSGCRGQNIR